MPAINYKSNFKPFPQQSRILDSLQRFIVAACGRRGGKTAVALHKFCRTACSWRDGKGRLYWWAAPTYKRSKKAFFAVKRALKAAITHSSVADLTITLCNGVLLEFVSLKDWHNLKGDGLDGVVIDEAALCPRQAYYELLVPATADKKGWILIISTPRANNWFKSEFERGVDVLPDGKINANRDPDYEAISYKTLDNPFIDPAEVDRQRKSGMPEDLFRQEFEAKFLDESSGVFSGMQRCVPTNGTELYLASLRCSEFGEQLFNGTDLGRHHDFSVNLTLAVPPGSRTGYLIAFDRFNQLDWKEQEARIGTHYETYPGESWIDSSGPGETIYENLVQRIPTLHGFKYQSPGNRNEALRNLQVMIASGQIKIRNDITELEVIWSELKSFEYVLTPGGKLTMKSVSGAHDDTVMALALAAWGMAAHLRLGGSAKTFEDFSVEAQMRAIALVAGPRSDPSQLAQILGPSYNLPGSERNRSLFHQENYQSPFTGGALP